MALGMRAVKVRGFCLHLVVVVSLVASFRASCLSFPFDRRVVFECLHPAEPFLPFSAWVIECLVEPLPRFMPKRKRKRCSPRGALQQQASKREKSAGDRTQDPVSSTSHLHAHHHCHRQPFKAFCRHHPGQHQRKAPVRSWAHRRRCLLLPRSCGGGCRSASRLRRKRGSKVLRCRVCRRPWGPRGSS